MTTPVLLVSQTGQESTKTMTDAEIDAALANGYVTLPADEGLDKATCYILPVNVTG